MIIPKNVLRHEIIGLEVKIENSSDQSVIGIEGTIIDETQNTLAIRKSNGKEIKVAKKDQAFVFTLPDSTKVRIAGKLLQGDPIERLKKKQPGKWDVI